MKEIETERLILRNWNLSDSKDLFEYAKSDLVGPNAGWLPHKNEEESKKIINMFIKNDDVFAIELKSEKKVIGSIGIHRSKSDEKDRGLNHRIIGYVLNPNYWGRGFATEAVERVLDFCFNDMNLDLVCCGHFEDNLKSKKIIEKFGFSFKFKKGILFKLFEEKIITVYHYSLSKYDYNRSLSHSK
ncbi:MAG: GNAT family N-acetyltransferase [Candidatus Cloacimonadota bacterium]|nr:MAG: GNAT family N-acetyltransferase [Candidatus Cloacimonadota bacterium]PIE77885.1 MAG: GNAT family N-acetyltransferase [Candidatus Delongbacteria bacterium]